MNSRKELLQVLLQNMPTDAAAKKQGFDSAYQYEQVMRVFIDLIEALRINETECNFVPMAVFIRNLAELYDDCASKGLEGPELSICKRETLEILVGAVMEGMGGTFTLKEKTEPTEEGGPSGLLN